MAGDPVVPNRDVLRKFLPNDDVIIRFEKLFKQTGVTLPAAINNLETNINNFISQTTNLTQIVSVLKNSVDHSFKNQELISIKKDFDDLKTNLALSRNEISALKKKIQEIPENGKIIIRDKASDPAPITQKRINIDKWDIYHPSMIFDGSAAAAETAYSGNFYAPEFTAGAAAETRVVQFFIEHSYHQGKDVIPVLFFYVPDDGSGGDIKINIEYQWSNVGDTGAYSSTTISKTETFGASAGIYQNHAFIFSAISGTGKEIRSILNCVISRDHTDVADTFASSCWLLKPVVIIRKDKPGSRTEHAK